MDAQRRGRLLVISAAVCWSLAGVCVKLARPLDAWQIAGLRSLVAFFFLGALLKLWRARPLIAGIKVALLAFGYGLCVSLFIVANTLTTSANAIFLQDTAPVWVLLIAPFMLKEPFRLRDLGMLFVCGIGMTLFFLEDLSPGQRSGNIISLISGVGFAFVILGMRWGHARDVRQEGGTQKAESSERTEGAQDSSAPRGGISQDPAAKPGPNESEQIAIWGNLFCFLLCLPMMSAPPLTHEYAWPLALVCAMGAFQLGLGYLFLARGINHVPAMEASLLVLVEPVLNPLWTFLVLGERPSAWALAGGSVIIGSVAFQALRGRE